MSLDIKCWLLSKVVEDLYSTARCGAGVAVLIFCVSELSLKLPWGSNGFTMISVMFSRQRSRKRVHMSRAGEEEEKTKDGAWTLCFSAFFPSSKAGAESGDVEYCVPFLSSCFSSAPTLLLRTRSRSELGRARRSHETRKNASSETPTTKTSLKPLLKLKRRTTGTVGVVLDKKNGAPDHLGVFRPPQKEGIQQRGLTD